LINKVLATTLKIDKANKRKKCIMASKKKAVSKKKAARKKRTSVSARKSVATKTRNNLTKQLREDLRASKAALRAANAAAREELKLTRQAAKAEVALLKEQLAAAHKREQALLKVSEQKVKMMWKAGEQWEKKQLAKIQKAFRVKRKASR
jgi:hypothetical protein